MLRFFSSRCFFSLQAKSDIVTLLLSRRWTTIEAFEILEGHTKNYCYHSSSCSCASKDAKKDSAMERIRRWECRTAACQLELDA